VLGLTPEEAKEKPFIASMGIYVFKKGVLGKCLFSALLSCFNAFLKAC
jgi:ADP-glucose pyrophosphorylase